MLYPFLALLFSLADFSGENPVRNDSAGILQNRPGQQSDVQCWLTRGDRSALLSPQNEVLTFRTIHDQSPVINVNENQTYQTMDGFGYTLTGGSALLIGKMGPKEQAALLKELFARRGSGIGVSYLRISVGASDLNADVFTYDDLPEGQTDAELKKFSLQKDMDAVIPLLKKIVAINPEIKILGSPWSAPAWMKTNGSLKGGSLIKEYYSTYARYLVKYIRAMKAQGIPIDALTPQNEPLHGGNNPSMVMTAAEQADFIGKNLGPELRNADFKTKIIAYDHNADKPEYPMTVLADATAAPFVDGSAFHLYGGDIRALSKVHDAFPEKNLYFTEQWVGGPGNFAGDLTWHVRMLSVGASRNWAKTVLEWNLANGPDYRPHTDGGCTTCLGAITLDGSKITRNTAYYSVAHSSKFVPPGSVRIASNEVENLPNVAYKTPSGKKVLLVVNTGNERQTFNITYKGRSVKTALDGGAVSTYLW